MNNIDEVRKILEEEFGEEFWITERIMLKLKPYLKETLSTETPPKQDWCSKCLHITEISDSKPTQFTETPPSEIKVPEKLIGHNIVINCSDIERLELKANQIIDCLEALVKRGD